MRSEALVSVIIAAFNAEKTIGQAITSVLNQTYGNIEVIVVDDGSSDRTVEVVKKFQDRRISILKHARNLGPGVARNAGIDVAAGDWITFLDADDAWRQDRIATLLETAQERAEACFVADDIEYCFDTAGGLKPWKTTGVSHLLPRVAGLSEFLRAGAPLLKPMIPAAHLRQHHLRFDWSCRMGEDLELVCHLFRTGLQLRVVPEALYLYRVTPGSLSRRPERWVDLVAVYDRLLASGGFSEEERKLLRELRSRVEALLEFEPVRQALVSGAYGRALVLLGREPRLLGILVPEVAHSIRYRLAARLAGAAVR